MFSLIISIIAIALVAALALASIYYGGEAFQEGTVDASAATLIDQGQQIEGAVRMAENQEYVFSSIEDLAPMYLKGNPEYEGNTWSHDGSADLSDAKNLIIKLDDTPLQLEVCQAIQETYSYGDNTVPTINSTADLTHNGVYGCFEDADDGGYTFYYLN